MKTWLEWEIISGQKKKIKYGEKEKRRKQGMDGSQKEIHSH